jgi:hypothetical protein
MSNKVYAVVYIEPNEYDCGCGEYPDSIWYDKEMAEERCNELQKEHMHPCWFVEEYKVK